MVNKKDNKIKKMSWVAMIFFFVVIVVAFFVYIEVQKPSQQPDYSKYSGLYHSETGLKHCVTARACLTSTEVYLSDTGLCAIGGTTANSDCHWEYENTNKISIKYESDESFSYGNVELVDDGIIIKGVLFKRVRR